MWNGQTKAKVKCRKDAEEWRVTEAEERQRGREGRKKNLHGVKKIYRMRK